MRDILFKAKRIDNGEWVEGFLFYCLNNREEWCIGKEPLSANDYSEIIGEYVDWFPIDENTLCQYTGLTDKNGRKIWENDIVEYQDFTDEQYVVAWETSKVMFEYQQYGCSIMNFDELSGMEVEVIGNIFDNKDLMGG